MSEDEKRLVRSMHFDKGMSASSTSSATGQEPCFLAVSVCVCVCECGARAIKDLRNAKTSIFYTEALLRNSFAPLFAPCVVYMHVMPTAVNT